MKIEVRYYTKSGNTKKLAQAVAQAVSVQAEDISCALTEKADILFLGCSYYAFDVDPAVKDFIIQNKDNIGKIVCFGTSAMMKSIKKPVTRVAKSVGIAVADDEFHCRGQFKSVHKGRPDANDLEAVSAFAKKFLA